MLGTNFASISFHTAIQDLVLKCLAIQEATLAPYEYARTLALKRKQWQLLLQV